MKEAGSFSGTLKHIQSAPKHVQSKDENRQFHVYNFLEFEGTNGENIRVEMVKIPLELQGHIEVDSGVKTYVLAKVMEKKAIIGIREGNKEYTLLDTLPTKLSFFEKIAKALFGGQLRDAKMILNKHGFRTERKQADMVL